MRNHCSGNRNQYFTGGSTAFLGQLLIDTQVASVALFFRKPALQRHPLAGGLVLQLENAGHSQVPPAQGLGALTSSELGSEQPGRNNVLQLYTTNILNKLFVLSYLSMVIWLPNYIRNYLVIRSKGLR